MPGEPEFAIGAIAAPDIMIRDPIAAAQLCTHALSFEQLVQLERPELERRERLYRGSRGALDLRGKTIILVDDGLATGASMLAAVRAARSAGAAHILAAAPIASQEALARLRDEVQALVALRVAAGLMAVGDWYDDFEQLTDAAVGALLAGYLSNTG